MNYGKLFKKEFDTLKKGLLEEKDRCVKKTKELIKNGKLTDLLKAKTKK